MRETNNGCERVYTSHSLWPWCPSWLRVLTATVSPVPGFAGPVPFSSIQPLKTQPNPPSPRILSGLKFLVANFSSLNVNFRSWEETLSSSLNFNVEEILNFDVDVELNLEIEKVPSVLLVVVEDPTEATGWSLLFSFTKLLPTDLEKDKCTSMNDQDLEFAAPISGKLIMYAMWYNTSIGLTSCKLIASSIWNW